MVRFRFQLFLTLCTAEKQSGLTTVAIVEAFGAELAALDADAKWSLRCSVLMPDHFHALVVLGERLLLGRAVQRLKAKTAAALALGNLRRERNFFDHKLRPSDSVEPIFHYIYLNPYRAKLVARNQSWPHFHCSDNDRNWFRHQLDCDLPFPEWLES